MSKKFHKSFSEKALRAMLCLLFVGAVVPAGAQDEVTEQDSTETEAPARRRIAKKQEKQYKMQTISGTIKDNATGEPLEGVRVQALQLPRYSALTDEKGNYTLEIPVFSHALIVEAPGYNLLQMSVTEGEGNDAKLLSDKLSKFYTDGTTIIAQRTIELDETSSISVETDMQNRLAGDIHSVNRSAIPGQGAYFTIRGINSLNANAQPLFIIDGNMVDLEEDRTSLHEGFYNNLLAGLDPEDVASIQVIKNATALYGAKGANGVVIINTKRGHSQATKINARVYGGVELIPSHLKVMDGTAYRRYLGELAGTIKEVKDSKNQSLNKFAFLSEAPLSGNYYYDVFHNNTDWQEDMYRTALTQNYKINVQGGDDVGMYSLSLGYTNGKSTLKGTDFNRLSLRFNTDIKMFEKITTAIDISYNQVNYNVLDNGWSENYDMQNIGSTNVLGLVQAPFLSPYAYYHDENTGKLELSGEYAGKYASTSSVGQWKQNPFQFASAFDPEINESLRNPYWVLENSDGKNKNYAELSQICINFAPKYEVNKHLTIGDRISFTLNRNNERYFLPKNGATEYELTDLGNINSVLKSQFTKETTINNDLRIEWKNNYGAHTLNAFGGWRYNNFSYSYSYTRGYNNENDKLPRIKRSMQYINYGGTKDNWIDMAYYANLDYNYANRYFLQVTASAQASSRFGKETKDGFKLGGVSWGFFPSIQFGWLISSEPWFRKSNTINYLKFTAGWDKSGNDAIDYYASRTYWESQQFTQNTVGLVLKNIENSSIQWETTSRWNFGLEGSFFDNRVTAGIDLFWSKTDNLLTMKGIDYISGLSKNWSNDGQLKNHGYEMHFNAAILDTRYWKWEVGASVGHYINEITKLPDSDQVNGMNGFTTSVYGKDNVLTAVGYAAGVFYGWQTNGILRSDAEASTAGAMGYLKYPTGLNDAANAYRNFQAGDVRFVDQNKDGIIDDRDKVVIGDPNPDIYGNIFTSLTWKNLRLDANFKYSLGNDIYNYQRSILEGGNTTYNQTTAMQNRWTHEGHDAALPKVCYTDSEDWRNNERMSDRWIEDGSYLKLKNVRLTYTFPFRNEFIQGLKVWGEANNVFVVTKYLGTDPEMSSRNSVLYQGIDTGILTNGRSFNLGVTINL